MSDTELLAAMLTELQAIRAAIESRAAGPDHAGLLRAISASWGAELFTASELLLYARRPGARALDAAIRATGIDSARRLGKLLATLEGEDCAGLTVQRVGTDRDGRLWKIFGSAR